MGLDSVLEILIRERKGALFADFQVRREGKTMIQSLAAALYDRTAENTRRERAKRVIPIEKRNRRINPQNPNAGRICDARHADKSRGILASSQNSSNKSVHSAVS